MNAWCYVLAFGVLLEAVMLLYFRRQLKVLEGIELQRQRLKLLDLIQQLSQRNRQMRGGW